MEFKKEYKDALDIVRYILSFKKYRIVSLIFGIVSFVILYYLSVAKVANNSVWISVMMSGAVFVTFGMLTIIITSILSGILFSMLLFKFDSYKKLEKKGLFGFVGSGVSAFGVGCPTCGAFLFGLIGMPLALTYFPFKGLELQILGIIVLIFSIYFAGKSISGVCKPKY